MTSAITNTLIVPLRFLVSFSMKTEENNEELLADLPDPSLMPVLTTEGGYILPVSKLLKILPDNIDEEYRLQASWFATVCYQTEIREVELERLERRIKELESAVYLTLRGDVTIKKPSEASLKAAIVTHAGVKKAWKQHSDLRRTYVAWSSVKQGLIQKLQMLINLGASRRLDKKASLSE